MGKFIDLTEQRFGRLTVLKEWGINKWGNYKWICNCDCGNQIITTSGQLRGGHTKSCGCLEQENRETVNKKFNTYDLTGEYGIGYTSNTNEPFYFDIEDYNKIKDYCWRENKYGYIITQPSKSKKNNLVA